MLKFVDDSLAGAAALDEDAGMSVLDLLSGRGVADLTGGLGSRTCKLFLRDIWLFRICSLVGGGFGRFFIFSHCGICRVAVTILNTLVQCGHYFVYNFRLIGDGEDCL